jgi:pimeloyl-ACP methyl ester carboxylesterase
VEEVIQLSSGDGPLFGIVHEPENSRTSTGIVFLNAGARSRRGPNCLYVRLARRLCAAGYRVLRYDPPLIGDGPGELQDGWTYKRRFVEGADHSSRCAIDHMKNTGVERVVVFGLCGGAYSGMVTAASCPDVNSMLLVSLPVQETGDLSEESATDWSVQNVLGRSLTWRAWYRLLTGKSQYIWLPRALLRLVRGQYQRPRLADGLWQSTVEFFSSGRRALYVFGDQDPLYRPFVNDYLKRLDKLDTAKGRFEIHVVKNATHTFPKIVCQNELMDRALEWLGKHSTPPSPGPRDA